MGDRPINITINMTLNISRDEPLTATKAPDGPVDGLYGTGNLSPLRRLNGYFTSKEFIADLVDIGDELSQSFDIEENRKARLEMLARLRKAQRSSHPPEQCQVDPEVVIEGLRTILSKLKED